MKWWEDSVDEMFIGAMVTIVACIAIWKGGAAGMTVAGTGLGVLGVYLGVKPGKRQNGNGGNNAPPTT